MTYVANDIWGAWSQVGTATISVTSGILSVTDNSASANGHRTLKITAKGGDLIRFDLIARAVSGTGTMWFNLTSLGGFVLGQKKITGHTEFRSYTLSAVVPHSYAVVDVIIGVGCTVGDVGTIEAYAPNVFLNDTQIVTTSVFDERGYRAKGGLSYDGTAGYSFNSDGDMTGGLFSPAANSVSIATGGAERLRVESTGSIGIGGTGYSSSSLLYAAGGVSALGASPKLFHAVATIPSNATTDAACFRSAPSVQNASFTLPSLFHFAATEGTYGASATITNQYGFYSGSALVDAANNYGFFSNIPSGTGRWNFYADGTADNYLAGNLGVGSETTNPAGTSRNVNISGSATSSLSLSVGSTLGAYFTTNASSYAKLVTQSSIPILFAPNGTDRVWIGGSNGHVGIGVSPSYPLHLLSGTFPQFVFTNSSANSTTKYGMMGFGHYTNTEPPASIFYSFSDATNNVLNFGGGAPQMNAASLIRFFTAANNTTTTGSERLRIDSAGNIGIGTSSPSTPLTVNGVATLCSGTATPAGGSTSARLLFGTTAGFGIYYGSGAPTVSAAQGSIYLRSDGSSTSTRLYVNTNGSTSWTNVTTAA